MKQYFEWKQATPDNLPKDQRYLNLQWIGQDGYRKPLAGNYDPAGFFNTPLGRYEPKEIEYLAPASPLPISGDVKYKISIDKKEFEVSSQLITGSELKAFVNPPSDYGIWVKLKAPKKDIEISNSEPVDLAQPDRDIFFTGPKYTTEGDVQKMAEERYPLETYLWKNYMKVRNRDGILKERSAFIAGHQARDGEVELLRYLLKESRETTDIVCERLKNKDGEVEKLVEALKNVKKNIDDLQPVIDLYKIIDEALKPYQSPEPEVKREITKEDWDNFEQQMRDGGHIPNI